MLWRRVGCLAALAVLLLGVGGCGRSEADVARQRRALEAALAGVPLPAGSRLDTSDAVFDAGCHGFVECADGPETDASYSVAIRPGTPVPPTLAELCRMFVAAAGERGLRLVTVWRGARASHDTTPGLPVPRNRPQPRWVDVTAQLCATQHVQSAVVVDGAGASPTATAHVVLSLADQHPGDGPRYLAIASRLTRGPDGSKTVARLPVDSPALTWSPMAYLRGTVDREFVLAADPAVDGIHTPHGVTDTWIVPAGVAAVRFRVICSPGDDLTIRLWSAAAAPAQTHRTVECGLDPVNVDLATPARVVDIGVTVHEHRVSASHVPRLVHGQYTVRAAPVRLPHPR